ncbi:MAG: carboxypeptidase-like regulatory domain-containing protein [bacterium]
MKRISLALSAVFLFAFFSVGQVHAAPLQGFISDCLGAVENSHTATLTIKSDGKIKPQASTDTYIMVCITGEKLTGTKCTTGNATTDKALFDKFDDLTALQAITNKVGGVDGGKNPTKTNADGSAFTDKITWSDEYQPSVTHQFSWLQADKSAGQGGNANGGLGSQQQGTFDFAKATADTTKCIKIGWDPRGYVFDAATLNPVKDISVTLLKGPSGGIFEKVPSGLGVTNPDTSRSSNGQYSFYVEPGYYKLELDPASSTKIASLTTVNSAYQNLFLSEAGKTNIYQKNEEVMEQKGMVAIAHIPVTVTNPALLITSLQTIENGTPVLDGKKINVFGRVSHPKSTMILTTKYSYVDDQNNIVPVTLVKKDVTNELGEYDKDYEQDQIDGDGHQLFFENLNVSFELNTFYTIGVFSRKENVVIGLVKKIWNHLSGSVPVNASTSTSYNVAPIPTYIEGIAYDTAGKAIPGAIVGVYTTFSNNPVYMTVADQDGRYKIGSQHLPRFSYELRYKKPTGEVVIVSTGTFIKQNIKLFAAEGIKPFEEKKTTVAEDAKAQDFFANTNTSLDLNPTGGGQNNSSNNKYVGGGSNNSSSSRNQTGTTTQTGGGGIGAGMQGIVMIVVVIMVLVMIGVGAFIMMKSKQQAPPQY